MKWEEGKPNSFVSLLAPSEEIKNISKIQAYQLLIIHNQTNITPLNLGATENSLTLAFNYLPLLKVIRCVSGSLFS